MTNWCTFLYCPLEATKLDTFQFAVRRFGLREAKWLRQSEEKYIARIPLEEALAKLSPVDEEHVKMDEFVFGINTTLETQLTGVAPENWLNQNPHPELPSGEDAINALPERLRKAYLNGVAKMRVLQGELNSHEELILHSLREKEKINAKLDRLSLTLKALTDPATQAELIKEFASKTTT